VTGSVTEAHHTISKVIEEQFWQAWSLSGTRTQGLRPTSNSPASCIWIIHSFPLRQGWCLYISQT
jgi:hypothetical protein